jgi:asparagine synthase (glutamine-hydrolysing)
MCGIAGVFEIERGRASLEMAELLGSFMTHRGPDNFGKFGFDHAAFAHNRLSLLDLSDAANQPFQNDNYALVYNGEIYNFQELRDYLIKHFDQAFKTTSDTEVLFYLLIHEGINETCKKIRGMFSFAFYDRRKHVLYLARDRYGIKPLYYHLRNGALYWSSETKALVNALGIAPNPLKTLLSINGSAERSNESTLFDDVFSLKPGSYMKFAGDCRSGEKVQYYSPIDDVDPEIYLSLERCSADEIVDRFDQLLKNSVRRMLVSDIPVGAFVSGGVDSALISAIANQVGGKINLFTADVVGKHSEFTDAKILSDHTGARLFDHKFKPEDMLSEWAETTYYYETPLIVHTNAIPFSSVARLANRRGVKAVLTGEGADELFLGYPRLLARRYNQIASFPLNFLRRCYSIVPGLKEFVFSDQSESSIEFAARLVSGFDDSIKSSLAEHNVNFVRARDRQEHSIALKLIGAKLSALLHRNDRMGMMASIEARFPYLDEDVVRFGLNLPPKFKIGRSMRWHNFKHPFLIDKWVIRALAAKYLPKPIANKQKNGFPMHGHKDLNIRPDFFKGGWLEQKLKLDRKSQEYMIQTENPYYVAKLASIEIFGKIFGMAEKIDTVRSHILSNSSLSSTESAINN